MTLTNLGRAAPTIAVVLILVFVFGQRAWMNIRPADPLPHGFEVYTAKAFEAAQRAGQPIIVSIYASWCPTCMRQHEALADLLTNPQFEEVRGFRVDFDIHEDFRREYGVQTQSTIITFRGRMEMSRTVGAVRQGPIEAQLRTLLEGYRAAAAGGR